MRRFIMFAGSNYYPSGGVDDIAGTYETLAEAETDAIQNRSSDWIHVLDTRDGKVHYLRGQYEGEIIDLPRST